MRKLLLRLLCLSLVAGMLLPLAPGAKAVGTPMDLGLDQLITDGGKRRYVEMMVGYHLRGNKAVIETLEEGYSALFFFEGCSDNMKDPELSDISYYRVSAVCLAVRLDEEGMPYVAYFDDNCSTLPDRPLEYGAWKLEEEGEVGPATIRDGTYALYSVKHGGAYEALHLRTSEEDDTIPAVYMNPEGYVNARATQINIHTRTGNHVIQRSMWSAGCILVGEGEFGKFAELLECTYYRLYDTFALGQKVGSVTVDRQNLKEKMYSLYENRDAVDMLLADSRQILPQTYLRQCGEEETYEEPRRLWATREAGLMTLPCSNATDARSVPVATVDSGQELEVQGCIRNSQGNLWYVLEWEGETCYLYSGYAENPGWFSRLIRRVFL